MSTGQTTVTTLEYTQVQCTFRMHSLSWPKVSANCVGLDIFIVDCYLTLVINHPSAFTSV